MKIQHNIMAMNAYRNMGKNNGALSKNLEKLSSGYRINRAGDDAAGLAISEKMRAQIAGLDQAQKNAQSGINLVQTAEGALTEVHDMLNRMVTLATQAANGTYSESDRAKIQAEIDSLTEEIDRIADNSNFNGTKLLDGSLALSKVDGGIPEGTEVQDVTVEVSGGNKQDVPAAGNKYTATASVLNASNFDAVTITYTNEAGEEKTLTLMEGAVNDGAVTASKAGEDLAALINDSSKVTLSDTSSNAKQDYEEFLDLFNVVGDGNSFTITAKDADSTAKVTSVKQGSNTAAGTAVSGATEMTGAKTEAAEAAHMTFQVTANTTAAASITIAGKEYVTSDDANGAASTVADKAKDLLKQLKADGYDVELDADDSTNATIKFKDMSQLQETQKGTEIVNAEDDKWDVNAESSTKGKVEFTLPIGAASSNDITITLNYVNEKGENTSKEVSYADPAASAGNAAAALQTAIEGDSELSKYFKVSVTAASDKVTIESKSSGTSAAHITGVETSSDFVGEVKVTAPEDVGKALVMAKKADGTTSEVIKNGDQITIDGKTYQFMTDTGKSVEDGVVKVALDSTDAEETWKNLQAALKENGVESELHKDTTGTVDGLRFTDHEVATEEVTQGGMTLQIGSEAVETIEVAIDSVKAEDLGIKGLKIGKPEEANEAIGKVKDAIETVSVIRGNLGAVQNRLEHTINNLGVMEENIQDAEANIRDTDIADEMMAYTKNNILIQSAQAMLAQANQAPQGVLQLMG